jgi:hypothetical protein
VKVDVFGAFVSPFFKAPVSKKGDHVITVSDGTNTAKITFTMESNAPKIPPPLKPALGAKLKTPMNFDWSDVTDESLPVTYRLQISGDKTFDATSVLVDKSGIDSSSYTLTETEAQKLVLTDTPYYWRVKAIDAASNESEWTGASLFYAKGAFKFPTWGIYISIIGGALFFFLIGMWIGRRTAFYY